MTFTKHGVVLDVGAALEWDDKTVVTSGGIYRNNLYYIYYAGNSNADAHRKIGLTTSFDGLTFTKHGVVLNLGAAGEFDDWNLDNAYPLYKNNLMYLYYTGDDQTKQRIGLATSEDGVTFTKHGMVLDLGAGGAFDDTHVRRPTVVYKNNLLYMYYVGYDGSDNRIGLATSSDGLTFTKHGVVLEKGAGGAWDDEGVYQPDLTYKNNLYYMYYLGYDGSVYRIGLATSPDGLTFTKHGVVLEKGAGGAWDDEGVYHPNVIYKNNLYYMYYTGYDGTTRRLGLATSEDGV